MNADVRLELQRLLSSLCDHQLTPEEHRRLEELLASEECRRQYLEYMDMNAWLLTQPSLGGENAILSLEGPPGHLPAGSLPGQESVIAVPFGSLPGTAPLRQGPPLFQWAMVAAATLAASVLVQLSWFYLRGPDRGNTSPVLAEMPDRSSLRGPRMAQWYVATLTQTANCLWENNKEALQPGTRLAVGELRLKQGSALIHFDSGTDLILEGPTQLRVRSSTSALLLEGKVVFRADETAAPFDLFTPFSLVTDIGTEYGLAVDRDGEEIHVFEGEVQRTPRPTTAGAHLDDLKAGMARRYTSSPTTPGEDVAPDPKKFVRWLPGPTEVPAEQAARLLAYEGFDYKDNLAIRTGKGTGGLGWAGPWIPSFVRPAHDRDARQTVLNPSGGLSRPGAPAAAVGGGLDYAGTVRYRRKLATPIRMDRGGVYYLSFLFRRPNRLTDPASNVAIGLLASEEPRPDNQKLLTLGVSGSNYLFMHLHKYAARTPLPLNAGETYLLVAKIAASNSQPEQVMMRVYASDEPIDREEAGNWALSSPLFRSDLTFDTLEIHINGKTRQMLDEIRLGTTWSSVTAPWIAAPAAKKEGPNE